MKALQIAAGLAMAIFLMSCAHKAPSNKPTAVAEAAAETKVSDTIGKAKSPETEEAPLPEKRKNFAFLVPVGWEKIAEEADIIIFRNPENSSSISMFKGPGDSPAKLAELFHKTGAKQPSHTQSEIQVAKDGMTAWFTFTVTLKENHQELKSHGKLVALSFAELPEVSLVCIGLWPSDQDMTEVFDRFWMGIGLVD